MIETSIAHLSPRRNGEMGVNLHFVYEWLLDEFIGTRYHYNKQFGRRLRLPSFSEEEPL